LHSLNQIIKVIGDYLPHGKAWVAKRIESTNIYYFIKSIAQYLRLYFYDIEKLKLEMSPDTTTDLIDRWESDYGIPDDIIEVAATLADRRKNVILKMAGMGVQTNADFIYLATQLGYTINFETSVALRYPPYDIPMYPMGEPGCYFICVITIDLTLPNALTLIEYFRQLLPATVEFLVIDTNPPIPVDYLPYDVPFDVGY